MKATRSDLEDAMIKNYHRAKDEIGYDGKFLYKLIKDRGGYGAAKELVSPLAKTSHGFNMICQKKRYDLTVEALLMHSKWQDLFDPDEIMRARSRLTVAGAGEDILYPDRVEDNKTA